MFKKKDYITVRGIGKIHCSPAISAFEARAIGEVAESIPFVKDAKPRNDDSEHHEEDSKLVYVPEYSDFGFWVALLSIATDYSFDTRDAWEDIHGTNLPNKLAVFFAQYIDDLYRCAMERIDRKAKSIEPVNEAALFGGIAKSLEGVEIGDVLELAKSLSEMNGKEIVMAAATTEVP